MGSKDEGEGGRLRAPWSEPEWLADELISERDPELDRQLDEAGGKFWVPERKYAWRAGRGMPFFNNPYLNFGTAAMFAAVVPFLLFRLPSPASYLVASPFALTALLVITASIARVRRWHRLRRVARAYLEGSGQKLPRELRWYN